MQLKKTRRSHSLHFLFCLLKAFNVRTHKLCYRGFFLYLFVFNLISTNNIIINANFFNIFLKKFDFFLIDKIYVLFVINVKENYAHQCTNK